MKELLFLSKGVEAFPEVVDLSKKVAFVPTAAGLKDEPYFRKITYLNLKAWGYDIVDFDISNMEREELIDILNDVDVFFVAGGNTYHLLQELNKKDLADPIKARVESGMLYVGESAGAVLACPDIDYIRLMDEPEKATELKNTKGLGLFSTPIIPHADNPYHHLAATQIAKNLKHFVSLNEDQAIFVKVENNKEDIFPINSIL